MTLALDRKRQLVPWKGTEFRIAGPRFELR
jgi:hypothetical protein